MYIMLLTFSKCAISIQTLSFSSFQSRKFGGSQVFILWKVPSFMFTPSLDLYRLSFSTSDPCKIDIFVASFNRDSLSHDSAR